MEKKDVFYIGKNIIEENPIKNKEYQEILGIWMEMHPVVSDKINTILNSNLHKDYNYLSKDDLVSNEHIPEQREIQEAVDEAIALLKHMTTMKNGDHNHITYIRDTCVINNAQEEYITKHFWDFIKIVNIDYEKSADFQNLKKQLDSDNTLYILWWSSSDTYSMHFSHYHSALSELIQSVSDVYESAKYNKKIMWVCFGNQYMANLIWSQSIDHPNVTATVKWPLQISPSVCKITNNNAIPELYKNTLKWISGGLNNAKFSTAFTRSWYVEFDLLNSWNYSSIIPLIHDTASSWIVWWGTHNGNILWIQFHPEIDLKISSNNTSQKISKLLDGFWDSLWKYERQSILNNYASLNNVKKDIWESFYVFSILAFIRDIFIKMIQKRMRDHLKDDSNVSYDDIKNLIISNTSWSAHYNYDSWEKIDRDEIKKNWLKQVDESWKLLLNIREDWSVDRNINEISTILWIKSLDTFIKEHKQLLWHEIYKIRDFWAWDGSTLKELYRKLSNENIALYWVGDYIYMDLYSSIQKSNISLSIPENILKKFIQELYQVIEKTQWSTVYEKISHALNNHSFTIEKTKYATDYAVIKQILLKNFYSMFPGFFERIFLSKFNTFYLENKTIWNIDFQYAIRSTSHIWWREYMKVLNDFIYNSAHKWTIYFDNGIHQSYTWIPRILEIANIYSSAKNTHEFKLIYNLETNYFTSVIIWEWNILQKIDLEKHLAHGNVCVDPIQAAESSFFQLEYFLRHFINYNFKNIDIFWDFNQEIIESLIQITHKIWEKNLWYIYTIILDLINYISANYQSKIGQEKEDMIQYNLISIDTLKSYSINWITLQSIIEKEIYVPEWMNIYGKRKF